jgi:serine/threonine-protein kinase
MYADQDPVQQGDVIAGKYLVDRVIGRGGMGVVLAATHVELDQKVAIKMLLPALMNSDTSVERFLREARAAVRLKSQHVARVIDVGRTEDGSPFMVMEFLEGSDLGQVLERRGRLTVEESADFVLQACEAVAEAHSLGIVHRDLKPQNLFVTKRVGGQPLVKVLDFGISKSLGNMSSLTQTSSVVGSPMYMAPEQLRSSKKIDSRSDIWALGVVLRELCTGKLPFDAESIPELTLKVAGEMPRPVLEDAPDAPPELVEIINRCLEKDPGRRFQSVGDLAQALEPLSAPETKGTAARAMAVLTGTTSAALTSTVQSSPPTRGIPSPGATPQAGTGSRGAVVVETPQHITTSTPTGSNKGLILGLAVVGVAGVLGAVALLRPREAPAPPTGREAPAATTNAPPAEPPRPAPSAPTVTPVASTPEPVAPAASSAASPGARVGGAKTGGPAGPGPAKPGGKPKDDEIPAMR